MKLLLIGLGGIGSFVAEEIKRLDFAEQFPNTEITVCDFDLVEKKNITYQNFKLEDILRPKVEVISERYGFKAINSRIENAEQLKNFDFFIVACDNNRIRKLISEYCKVANKKFMDLRAEGRSIAYFTGVSDTFTNSIQNLENDSSCQLKYELDNGIIQIGNKIIAIIGCQLLLNMTRNETHRAEYICRI